MNLEVLRAGPLTTVQDLGRTSRRALGVGVSGALDAHSAAIANLLVGNPESAALLECTLAGPMLRFDVGARIALTGAAIEARCGDAVLPGWRPIDLPAGAVLDLGACRDGARSYLALGGGIDLARVLGARATDLRGGFGGVEGRALRRGDRLRIAAPRAAAPAAVRVARWWIDSAPDLAFADPVTVRVLTARDATQPADALLHAAWRVSSHSDRQGLRLEGEPLTLADGGERVSEPVAPGTVQLPPDGRPIVLLADAQTVGGYPRIAHVASVDLPRLAQCRPGATLRFVPIEAETAHRLAGEQRARRARIALAIAARAPA